MEDNRYSCGLRAQAQFQVARVMSSTSVFSDDVTVVTDRVTLKWFLTHMTGGGAVMSPPVLSCHPHGFGVSQHSFDFSLLLKCFLKVLRCVGPSVLGRWLCLTITADNQIAVAARLMVLRFPGVALHGVKLWLLDLRC